MAENVSTANYDIRRFDQTASVPTAQIDPNSGMEHAKHLQGFADAIGMFADKGGNAYKAKINKDRRDEAEARRKEIEARQEKNRKENEARVEAERIYTETGGGKSWQELNEKEKTEITEDFHGPDKGKPILTSTDAYRDKKTFEENLASGGLIKHGEKRRRVVKSGKSYLTKDLDSCEKEKRKLKKKVRKIGLKLSIRRIQYFPN